MFLLLHDLFIFDETCKKIARHNIIAKLLHQIAEKFKQKQLIGLCLIAGKN
jgi:hypothetical protein